MFSIIPIKKKWSLAFLLVVSFVFALPAQAQFSLGSVRDFATNRSGVLTHCGSTGIPFGLCIVAIILNVVKFLLLLAAALALAGIVYGGLMYILSLGDESKASRGKQAILYSVIGLIIAGTAGLILLVVQQVIKS